jgi:tripeptide aminopeptidase
MDRKQAIFEEFKSLVAIDSESGTERRFMEHLADLFERDFGAECVWDEAGNLVMRVAGEEGKEPVVLSCHGDTVKPGIGIEAVMDAEGKITSKGETILAADDKSGITEIIWTIRTARERGVALPPLEVVITFGEEVGLVGSSSLDYSLIKARKGIVIDGGDLHEIVIGGPTHLVYEAQVLGKAAHAAHIPSEGINALKAAANAVASFTVGQVDHETVCNIGRFVCDVATNVIPEKVAIKGEVRSLDESKMRAHWEVIKTAFEKEAQALGARFEVLEEKTHYKAYSLEETHPLVEKLSGILSGMGYEVEAKRILGGTDAANFNTAGVATVVIGTGGKGAHSLDESVNVNDMLKVVEVLLEVLPSL